MLKKLKIQNLVLIEKAEITFGEGFTILTGETGAGKSAILSAIRLLSGARADIDLIRNGSEMAIVEAYLGDFWVRRELYTSGKNRCFIDEAQVSLADLKEKTKEFLELVDQSSSQTLNAEEMQRSLLDLFSDLDEKTALFKCSFEEEASLQKQIEEMSLKDPAQILSWAEKDLELIEKVNWQKGEEEKLTSEHHLLTHAQELKEKLSISTETLNEIAPNLRQVSYQLEQMSRLDPSLQSWMETLKNSHLEIEEVHRSLLSYTNQMDIDSSRLSAVEERISLLESLKRKFGSTWEQVLIKKQALLKEKEDLFTRDEKLLSLKKAFQDLSANNLKMAEEISHSRKLKKTVFENLILQELKSLNLPSAQFLIDIKQKALSSSGLDQVTFLFSANPGLDPLPIHTHVSGGELSRLLLAIKIVLSTKDKIRCLVFDEIDSNVGGQTASILGEKLKKLSEKTQVICVSHFVQVAKKAQTHFGVYKQEQKGQAKTLIQKLSSLQREEEYTRMLGK